MRSGYALFLATTATLLTLAVPALARNADAQQSRDQPTAASCHAYQMTPDGTWTPVPCQEIGSSGAIQHKPASKSIDEEKR